MALKSTPVRITRIVERSEVAVSREALVRAGWRCEHCLSDTGLRVFVDRRNLVIVLCPSCRLTAGWAPISHEPSAIFSRVEEDDPE